MDTYKWRIAASWWFSQPSGYFNSAGNQGTVDLQRDLGFGDYSTFTGRVDWRFKRKQHLTFDVSPVESTKSATLERTITFQGETYNVGTQVSADLHALTFAPAYQYDFIRRDHGFLAAAAQFNLLDTSASLTGIVVVNGQGQIRTASGSILAPIPAIGPRGRWYPLHKSNVLDLDGSVLGMYLFGYGDFASARANVDFKLVNHWKASAGYQMGSRLSIHGSSDQIGIRLTQKGVVAGLVGYW